MKSNVGSPRIEILKAKAIVWWYGLPEIARAELFSKYFIDRQYEGKVTTDDIFIMYVGQMY